MASMRSQCCLTVALQSPQQQYLHESVIAQTFCNVTPCLWLPVGPLASGCSADRKVHLARTVPSWKIERSLGRIETEIWSGPGNYGGHVIVSVFRGSARLAYDRGAIKPFIAPTRSCTRKQLPVSCCLRGARGMAGWAFGRTLSTRSCPWTILPRRKDTCMNATW